MECNDKRIFVQVLKMRLAGDTAVSSYYLMKGVRFIYIMCYDICLKDKGDSMGKVTIKIFGIGDGGNTIIRHMLQHRLHGVEYIAVNTNRLALLQLSQEHKLLIGEKQTKGYGTGADSLLGKRAAIEAKEEICKRMKGADMILLCAGLGGGTGSGALPVFAQLARELHALTIAFVTLPFPFEGKKRMRTAMASMEEIYSYTDTCITLSNRHILQHLGNAPITSAFSTANSIIQQGIQALYELITIPVYINIDYADICTTMEKQKHGFIGVGYGSGNRKGEDAVKEALSASLLEHDIRGLHHAIVHICGNSELTLEEVQQIVNFIHTEAGGALDIIFGMAINDSLKDEVIVTILAAG